MDWYSNTLGFHMTFPRGFEFDDFVELTLDGQYVMHLFKAENHQPIERAVFAFDTDDLNEAHESLVRKGVEVSPITQYGDHSGFTFKDCDRNTLMICQYSGSSQAFGG